MPHIAPVNGSVLSDPFPSTVLRIRDRARLALRTDGDLNDEIENAMAGRFLQGFVAAPKEKRKAGADPRSAASLRTHAFFSQTRTRNVHHDEYLSFSPQDWFLEMMSLEDDTPEKVQKCIVRRSFSVFQRE